MTSELRKGDRVLIAGRREGITEGYIANVTAAAMTAGRSPENTQPADLIAAMLEEGGCLEIALISFQPELSGTRFLFTALRSEEGWRDLSGHSLTITKKT